jgi:hypothetical protein
MGADVVAVQRFRSHHTGWRTWSGLCELFSDIDYAEEPDDGYLIDLGHQVTEIINTGTVQQRKALISEIRLDGTPTATLVFQVPLSGADTVAILGTDARTAAEATVRACPPSVHPSGLEPGGSAARRGGPEVTACEHHCRNDRP